MSHANAALTPRARLRLAGLIVERGLDLRRGGEDVHGRPRPPEVGRALPRRRRGRDGRPQLRPHSSPTKTPPELVRQIVRLRWRHRLGPVQIAGRLGLPASTVHAVLVRCRINRLSHIDRVTGEPLRRYEHAHPGSLIHVDVTKFGNIPDGGGHRFVGRAARRPEQARHTATCTGQRDHKAPHRHRVPAHRHRRPLPRRLRRDLHRREGRHRRSASCTEPSPGSPNAASPSNASCPTTAPAYRSYAWRDACADLGITHKRTRPYRPQTNGKIERFHRTLADGWAYARFYDSTDQRNAALPGWLHFYNHHRAHSAIGGQPPITPTDQPPWTSQLASASERIETR